MEPEGSVKRLQVNEINMYISKNMIFIIFIFFYSRETRHYTIS